MAYEPSDPVRTSLRRLGRRAAMACAVLCAATMALFWPRQPVRVRCTCVATALATAADARSDVNGVQHKVRRLATVCGLPAAEVQTSGSQTQLHLRIVAESQSAAHLHRCMQALQRMLSEFASAGQFHSTAPPAEQPGIWTAWQTAYRNITEAAVAGSQQWEAVVRQLADRWVERESTLRSVFHGPLRENTAGDASVQDGLAARIEELERQLEGLLATRTEFHPQVRQVREELAQLLAKAAPIYAVHSPADQDVVGQPPRSVAALPMPSQLVEVDMEFRRGMETVLACGKDCLQRLQREVDHYDEQMRLYHSGSMQPVAVPSRLVIRPLEFSYHGGVTAADWSLIVASSVALAVLVYVQIRHGETSVLRAPTELPCRLSWPVLSVIGPRPLRSYLVSLVRQVDRVFVWLAGGGLVCFVMMELVEPKFVFYFFRDPWWAVCEIVRRAMGGSPW